jgi:hypothetical protein
VRAKCDELTARLDASFGSARRLQDENARLQSKVDDLAKLNLQFFAGDARASADYETSWEACRKRRHEYS